MYKLKCTVSLYSHIVYLSGLHMLIDDECIICVLDIALNYLKETFNNEKLIMQFLIIVSWLFLLSFY